MYDFIINMQQFNDRWEDYSDNIRFGNSIRMNKGIVHTLDPRGYEYWLEEFNIEYTCTATYSK